MACSFGLRAAAWMTVLAGASLCADQARAYCRETVSSQPTGPCNESEGVPFLHWTRNCATYVFNNQLFRRLPALSESEIRETFNQAYQTWADVDCDRRSPFLVDQTSGTTRTSKAEFVYDEENEAIVVARTRSEWADLPNHDPTALAFTLLWHDKNTGEILDVDMELNTGAGRFDDCEQGCGPSMVDLANTITHEAGHLLGLGHSSVRGATMATTAVGDEIEKRTLEPDDRKGYCALHLPEFECEDASCACKPPPVYPSQRMVESCSCRVLGKAGGSRLGRPSVAASVLGIWLLRARRRRRRDPGPERGVSARLGTRL